MNSLAPCLLLNDVAVRLDCTIEDILDLYTAYGDISLYVIPTIDSYIWLNDGSLPVTPPIGGGVILEDFEVKRIIEYGKTEINFSVSGYLSSNQKFKFAKVTVTYQQLAVSEDDFKFMSEPHEFQFQSTNETNKEIEPLQNKAYQTDQLKILTEASYKFWGNADPAEKDTHTKNEIVIDWLIEQSFSKRCAEVGATIIRPEWAAKGKY